MWARTQLKIDWADLFSGALGAILPGSYEEENARAEQYWGADDTLTAYSVRSGFDLLLQALELSPGDEILYSALNVKGMVKISQRLGFTPVPVDLDVANLKPRMEALEAAVSKKSKVLVIAHLMGTRMDLAPYAKFAKKHNLILVEDCAQVFDGQNYKGAREADICMFSFGPLKTATSLGGALIRVRDKALLEKMRNIQSDYALQTQKAQRKRVFKFMALKIITSPFVMGLIYRFYSSKGENYEDSLSNKVRDVAPLGNSNKLRMRPSLGMLRLLNRRLYTYPSNGLEERTKKGEFLRDQLGGAVVLPGGESSIHSYWVFCLLADDPQTYIDELRKYYSCAVLPWNARC